MGSPSLPLNGALAEWWTLLESAELNGLIARALTSNPDLRIAALRAAQSHARLAQANADEAPALSLPYQVKTFKPANGVGTVNPNEKNISQNTYQLSVQGSWRADIWGERAAMYDSAEFQLLRALFQKDDVQRNLVVNIVNSYTELLALNERLRVSNASEVVMRDMLTSVEMRMEKGDATIIELDQQKAAVHTVKATIPLLEQQRVVVLNRLASLAGTVPGELKLSDNGLDSIKFPTVIPGVPSALLLRRPDVRMTEARLLAANADINVARTRLLPPLDLSAEVGYGSFYLSKMIQPYSFIGSLAANLSATIFDHGKRSKDVAFAEAVREELVEAYVKVIYDAVREVDDALSAIRLMSRRLESQQMAVEASRRAWQSSITSYQALAVDYLVVLDTERSHQRSLDDWYSARLDKYKGMISLFGALGGGVPMTGELPGGGTRPAGLPKEADFGMVVKVAIDLKIAPPKDQEKHFYTPRQNISPESEKAGSSSGSSPPEKVTAEGLEWSEDEFWMVEIAGLHDRAGLTSVWQDLRARFSAQMGNQTLLPRRQEQGDNSKAWYRLLIAKFPTAKVADDLCMTLRSGSFNCRVVSSRSLKHLIAGSDPSGLQADRSVSAGGET